MRARRALPFAAAVVAAVALLAGCPRQSEGQRCSVDACANQQHCLAGEGDCADGLVCTAGLQGNNSDVCCPESGVSNHPACIPFVQGSGGGGAGGQGGSGVGGLGGSGGAGGGGGTGGGGAGGQGGTGGTGGAGGSGGAGGN